VDVSRSTETEAGPRGPVIVKRASGPDAAPLRCIGDRLVAAAHPGVVEVLSSMGTEEEWELRLAHGGRPLDVVGQLTPEQVAGVVAAVATTLGDLHASGIVHGAVEASHVLVGAHGRPVLCGFAPDVDGLEPADDVAALGALMVSLLGTEDDPVLLPQRRFGRSRSPAAWTRRSLLLLADHACAEPATRRPSARRLAAEVSEAVPGPALDRPLPDGQDLPSGAEKPEDHPFDPLDALRAGVDDTSAPGPRLPGLACALVGAIVLGAGGVQLARLHIEGAGTAPTPFVAVAPERSQPTTTTSAPTAEVSAGPPSTCVPLPGVTGGSSGCAAPVVVDGSTVLVGSVRYEVGEPGDQVTLGDWDCDGAASPAVLRPSTGEVFVFGGWARDGDVAVRAIDRVEGADRLLVEAGADGCAHLVVLRLDGSRRPIPEAAEA
jgi:hypothetical protein